MRLTLERQNDDGKSTLGKLTVGDYHCWTLEDTYREEKVAGETRIPNGIYEIKFKTTGSWHQRNRDLGYPCGMLELQDVPGFTYILIHWGNYPRDTEGCILVGKGPGTAEGTHAIWSSKKAYKELYDIVKDELLCGNEVTIEIKGTTDENNN